MTKSASETRIFSIGASYESISLTTTLLPLVIHDSFDMSNIFGKFRALFIYWQNTIIHSEKGKLKSIELYGKIFFP